MPRGKGEIEKTLGLTKEGRVTGAFARDFDRTQHAATFSSLRRFNSAKRLRLLMENSFVLEEIFNLHFDDARNSRAGTIFSASASKRGSPRSGVRSGSTRIGPMLKPSRS